MISLLILSPCTSCFISFLHSLLIPWKNYLLALQTSSWSPVTPGLQIQWVFFSVIILHCFPSALDRRLILKFKPSPLLIFELPHRFSFCLSVSPSQSPMPLPSPFSELRYLEVFQVQFWFTFLFSFSSLTLSTFISPMALNINYRLSSKFISSLSCVF